MNIFAVSECPIECAKFLDDKRVVKMVLETAQLLSTVHHMCGTSVDGMYKATHPHHPCSVWARASKGNYLWLYAHFVALCDEYRARYFRVHKTASLLPLLSSPPPSLVGDRTPFANCAAHKGLGLCFKHLPVNIAYIKYLRARWETDTLKPRRFGLIIK